MNPKRRVLSIRFIRRINIANPAMALMHNMGIAMSREKRIEVRPQLGHEQWLEIQSNACCGD